MPLTTPDVVYARLLARIRSLLPTWAPERIQVRSLLTFDGTMTPQVQLIVPGAATVRSPDTGVGWVDEEFRVAVLERFDYDQPERYEVALTSPTNSVWVSTLNALRGVTSPEGIPAGLNGHLLKAAGGTVLCEGPIRLLGWGPAQADPQDPTFVAVADRYRIGYEVAYHA